MAINDAIEQALDLAKTSVYKHNKTIPEAIKFILLCSENQFFQRQLSKNDLLVVQNRLVEYFEKISQETACIIEDKRNYKPWVGDAVNGEYYSDRYIEYLKQNTNMAAKPIRTMSEDSTYILDRLGNPQSKGPFKRKGLVVGHVQSGKTANYISLINLAADYGYKLIILIAGVHNNLRSQTQQRINEGFIGYDQLSQTKVGVGAILDEDKSKRPITFTNTKDDFSAKNRDIAALTPEATQVPIILVIKKNGSILRSILKWLQQDNDERAKYIINYPALIIDDEADNASINTKHQADDPTAINRLIRELMNQFKQVSYVAYTATPFANIFIDPDVDHQHLGDDLFPDDFIVNLEAPSNYCGPKQFFEFNDNEEGENLSLCEIIHDYHDAIPIPTPKNHTIIHLPNSLKTAIRHFIIAMSIKSLRNVKNKHCSMLVNVAHRTAFQSEVRELIESEFSKIKHAVLFEGGKELSIALSNKYISELKNTYENYFDGKEYAFSTILQYLIKHIGSVQIVEINSTSNEKLYYEDYKENGLKVIAVGGYSLSRGFTLEGLITSYLLRNTAMADTLLQMSRWFGYRDGFRDLCKLFLPEKTYSWYSYIGQSMEELREEFRCLRELNLTPRQYGLRVRSSPAGLMITAKNKMQSSSYVEDSLSFSASIYQLEQLSLVEKNIQENLRVLESFNNELKKYDSVSEKTNLLYKNVSVSNVLQFMKQFQYVDKGDVSLCFQYIQDGLNKELKVWDVAFTSNSRSSKHCLQLGNFALNPFERTLKKSMFSKMDEPDSVMLNDGGGRIARIWEEKLGMTELQIQQAEEVLAKKGTKQSSMFYRLYRTNPLLIIKIMDIKQSASDQEGQSILIQKLVPGFAVSFPKSPENREFTYQVNKIYQQKLLSRYCEVGDEEVVEE